MRIVIGTDAGVIDQGMVEVNRLDDVLLIHSVL